VSRISRVWDFVNFTAERDKCGDDCAGAGPEYEIEPFIERATKHGLYFFEDAEGVEALRTSPIKA
jgi:hypothetical protein